MHSFKLKYFSKLNRLWNSLELPGLAEQVAHTGHTFWNCLIPHLFFHFVIGNLQDNIKIIWDEFMDGNRPADVLRGE